MWANSRLAAKKSANFKCCDTDVDGYDRISRSGRGQRPEAESSRLFVTSVEIDDVFERPASGGPGFATMAGRQSLRYSLLVLTEGNVFVKPIIIFIVLQLIAASAVAVEPGLTLDAVALPPLPAPVTNNAVTSVKVDGHPYLVSFNGLASGRTHSDTLSVTYVLDVRRNEWTEAAAVPGGVGRLASVAASVGELAYVFGGYSVVGDGTEVSTPWSHSFDPAAGVFSELRPMPVPVDDAVAY